MAFQLTGFSQRLIMAYKQRVALLPNTVTTDGVAEGLTYKFLVGDDGTDEATTRGANGRIQYTSLSRTQYSVTMAEYIAAFRETGFNIFTSQGNVEQMMHDAVIGKIMRKKDQVIITALTAATVTTASYTIANYLQFQQAIATLQNAGVPLDSSITFTVTPAFRAYMGQWTEFSNAQLVGPTMLPMQNGGPAYTDQIQMWRWNGVNVLVHPKLPGNGTAAETCFLYHSKSIGLGFATSEEKVEAGWDPIERASYCNMETYVGATVLQNGGIVKIKHDGSALQL